MPQKLVMISDGAVTSAIFGTGDENARRIEEQKAAGVTEIVIPVVKADTRFCGLYDLKYIGTDTYDTWPNVSMATYYGVEKIKGE